MKCTLVAVAAFLHYTPEPGTVVVVTTAQVAEYSKAKQLAAKICARRLGIKWKLVKE